MKDKKKGCLKWQPFSYACESSFTPALSLLCEWERYLPLESFHDFVVVSDLKGGAREALLPAGGQ